MTLVIVYHDLEAFKRARALDEPVWYTIKKIRWNRWGYDIELRVFSFDGRGRPIAYFEKHELREAGDMEKKVEEKCRELERLVREHFEDTIRGEFMW